MSLAQQETAPGALAQSENKADSPAALAQAQSKQQAQTNTQNQQQAQAQAELEKNKNKNKFSGHLHETDMRVDPPLTDEGKKSIKEAEKVLEEAKVDYDKKKAKAQELELAFHAASRISKSAREERAKAEDRYYVASKAARKASRYADNMEREARTAAAKQAAHDKYAEVVATSNKEATAKQLHQTANLATAQSSPPATNNATQSLAAPV